MATTLATHAGLYSDSVQVYNRPLTVLNGFLAYNLLNICQTCVVNYIERSLSQGRSCNRFLEVTRIYSLIRVKTVIDIKNGFFERFVREGCRYSNKTHRSSVKIFEVAIKY